MTWECCWTKNEVSDEDCPLLGEGDQELRVSLRRRFVEKCLECPRFRNDLHKMDESGFPFAALLPTLVDEYLNQKAQLQSMLTFLDSRDREIKFLHELSVVLQTSMDLEEVLSVAMTAITAGKGFGMNRAFLLLTDKDRKSLKGFLGVGPRNYEEAWRIWEEVNENDLSLKEMARYFHNTKLLSEKMKFFDILEKLEVPLNETSHILIRALVDRKPILVENAFDNPQVDRGLTEILGVGSFLIMPLISRNRRIGVLIADNCITHKPITRQDLQSLETFAFPVAFAIERASLYERLQEELEKVTAANAKLQAQQELIVKMEKMALVGKITSNIAHSIRNPLMVIGGFARSLLKNAAADDPKREYLESIAVKAGELETVLDEVLAYSDAMHPAMDMWDLNQLVARVSEGLRESDKGAELSLDLAESLPTVFIDFKQITHCVRSAIAKIMELADTGEVRIKTWQDADNVVLEIVSQRPVSNRELISRAQELFFTADQAGAGLGVSLCKIILEQHGARFHFGESEQGGARCLIRLPIRKER
ncbi:MAG: GAF domain-containing protein [Geobacter sp.]|nr:GAF domain-containing protein [Geobacter sp.]